MDNKNNKSLEIIKLTNCRIVYDTHITSNTSQLWFTSDGIIIDSQSIFYSKSYNIHYIEVDCMNHIISPGYIDIQINGGWGYDYTNIDDITKNTEKLYYLGKNYLLHGVTSYCPTVVSSDKYTYQHILPTLQQFIIQNKHRYHIDKNNNNNNNISSITNKHYYFRDTLHSDIDDDIIESDSTLYSEALGIHLEGPFISVKGAHNESTLTSPKNGIQSIYERYCESNIDIMNDVSIITMAVELEGAKEAINELNNKHPHITISCGHSAASISECEDMMIKNNNDAKGCRLITHMFNAIHPFHHRDPGVVGILGSTNNSYYFSIISDGQHTHPYSVNIAYKCHFNGLILITDAMSALGLSSNNTYKLGTSSVDIVGDAARISGTNTLAGSIASMSQCVKKFHKYTSCSIIDAIHSATLHPAKCLRLENRIGSLRIGNIADVCILDDNLNVKGVFKQGKLAWMKKDTLIFKNT